MLLGRLILLGAVLSVDVAVLAGTPHTASLLGALAPIAIVSFAVFVGLGYSYLKRQRDKLPFSISFFLVHAACIAAVSIADIAELRGAGNHLLSQGGFLVLRLVLLPGLVLLALAGVPFRIWIRTVRETGRLWLYSLLAGAAAWCLRFPMQSLWSSTTSAPGHFLQILAFHSVKALLSFLLPNIEIDPQNFIIGTPRFSVIIAEGCSGMEGLGLVLVFTVLWLWYFRRESRFPQALLLVPCALFCVWMLNILRIAMLVLIGNAGAPDVAMVGFHSQAGWIAFTTVAFTFSMATRKLSWVRRFQPYPPAAAFAASSAAISPSNFQSISTSRSGLLPSQQREQTAEAGESPATAAYLVPFLAILAASFVSKAASGNFEWLYPLRFVAAAVAIWHYRAEYKKLDWRFSWAAFLIGLAVFALWIIPTFWSAAPEPNSLGASLAALPPAARWTWIGFRIAAAVLTVPIAEELAFRGYLARRWIRLSEPDFAAIPFSAVTPLSIALSSIAFGLMHGRQWFVGLLAGLAYAGLMKWKGRLGDAVAAHAVSNLLLAAWVLLRGDWSQW